MSSLPPPKAPVPPPPGAPDKMWGSLPVWSWVVGAVIIAGGLFVLLTQ